MSGEWQFCDYDFGGHDYFGEEEPMPLYEYYCPECGTTFEESRPIADRDLLTICPKCSTRMERAVSSTGFKLTGGGGKPRIPTRSR